MVVLALALLGAGGVGAAALYLRSVDKDVERVDAFTGVPAESRPQVVARDAMNIMILGSDSRDPETDRAGPAPTRSSWPTCRRTGRAPSSISIPRDTWVRVPKSTDGRHGGRTRRSTRRTPGVGFR